MRCWHLTFATEDRLPLFTSESARLRCVRTVGRVVGPRLVLFILVDDHLHVLVVCTEGELGGVRRALGQGLTPITDRPLAPPRTRPVENRSHLLRTVDYLLNQTKRHGILVHPACWSGSCFADLVGARRIAGMQLSLFDLLPRVSARDVFAYVELEPVAPAGAAAVRSAGAHRLVDACFAAAGIVPGDVRPRGEILRARRAAASIGRRAGISRDELRWALGASPRTLRRLATATPDVAIQRAALLQIAIRDAVEEQTAAARRPRGA